MYNMMAVLISSIAPDVSLVGLVQRLRDVDVFDNSNTYEELMNQLVFMSIGWLSKLYDPILAPARGKLQISTDNKRRGSRRPGLGVRTHEQDFARAKAPLRTLLLGFGAIIPQIDRQKLDDMRTSREPEYLTNAYLNYYTLSQVCKLEIEWVDSLNLHLDLVQGSRKLRLFRFPSFCQTVWSAQDGECFLSR